MLKILFSCFSLQNNNDEIINKKPAIIPINNDEINVEIKNGSGNINKIET
jgi:hypothetical protein